MRIVKEDGAVGLFRGAGPTVVRAMALNMGMLASNDQVTSLFLNAHVTQDFAIAAGLTGLNSFDEFVSCL